MLVNSVLLSVILHIASTTEACQTPNGVKGNCVLLKDCPSLFSQFEQSTISSNMTTFLKKSHCGFSGRHPKVCCPAASLASRNLLPDSDSCGLYTTEKIIGGERTALDEFPWMALLQFQWNDGTKSFECGGSLINKRYVLTAAHCILPSLVGVRLGEYNTETNPDCVTNSFGRDCAPPAVDYGIEEKIVYENYNRNDTNFFHDIALIRLDRDVEYSDFIKPICLPLTPDEIKKTYLGRNLTVSGWGVTEKGVKSNVKLKVKVSVKDPSDCTKNYQSKKPDLVLNEGQMCAGGSSGGDSCKADSGGPLMALKFDKNHDPHFYAIGIVSFGPNPCAQENFPVFYTKVARYVTWIVDTIKP